MPFIYRNLIVSLQDEEETLALLLADRLGIPAGLITNLHIRRKGVDARRKQNIRLVHTLSFMLPNDVKLRARVLAQPDVEWCEEQGVTVFEQIRQRGRIVIVGSGPAGLFCALRLACYGLTATIVERGQPVEVRSRQVHRFWREGVLDPESNVQFGEGGAGTFSDGKLTCRSKDPLIPWVLEQLAAYGGPPEIRYLAKPHIGTDRLRLVVAAIRTGLMERGFEFRFGCRLDDVVVRDGAVSAVVLANGEELPCDRLILATGHSARDTYEMLEQRKIPLERKPFAMGLRVEHPQELIDRIQYGSQRHPALPVADYAVTYNNGTTGRSAYSFCMCPGGIVIAGASEEGGVVTNGMSGQRRNSPWANSALVVNVTPDDFGGNDPLAGVRFQRHWEQQAFCAGGGRYFAPAQNLMAFLRQPGSTASRTTYRPGITETALDEVLPPYIIATLREGIVDFNRRLRGFMTAEATLIGIESRTSAPVRVLRNENFESIGVAGLYPAGEGAGYAGGIMSSAVDGIRIADRIATLLGAE